ncbi:MAG: hypothetical protein CK530_06510 [Planctomycetaceae bacterium]|nr:MAG: hypothetical protein CK530_13010 [Planctomycetaceae bacterium]PHY02373.1 MAG: hypothetical protein CK530_06510 [Planctomycetaceae bacterium]
MPTQRRLRGHAGGLSPAIQRDSYALFSPFLPDKKKSLDAANALTTFTPRPYEVVVGTTTTRYCDSTQRELLSENRVSFSFLEKLPPLLPASADGILHEDCTEVYFLDSLAFLTLFLDTLSLPTQALSLTISP